MHGILYEEDWILPFLVISVILGGAAAWQTGRSIAQTWRPAWQVVPYMLVLGCAVRFLHFALMGGQLFTAQYYTVDTVILLALGFAGFQHRRAAQMATQYRWLYERTGPFSWRERSGNA
ncbi:hypothetical protein NK718_18055 [Alsobacter sp. SYSU M60028]|uniref:DUF6867 domain-containing protein n=1 Tax=Alsobacter ponti TaxID=2962936 RepID=A0ABT1LHT1_9HYPH|nr:hypothetical protein [Alsobacter ponti]MCP8940433.1 hypothetical protein [Alsobacter ponti]